MKDDTKLPLPVPMYDRVGIDARDSDGIPVPVIVRGIAAFSEQQMIDYAAQAVAKEREACEKLVISSANSVCDELEKMIPTGLATNTVQAGRARLGIAKHLIRLAASIRARAQT